MKKKYWLLLSTVFAIMLVLAACSEDESSSDTTSEKETEKTTTEETTTDNGGSTAEAPTLPEEVTNDGDVIQGGTLKYALVSESPFQGVLLPELYEDGYDSEILELMSNQIFETDGDFLVTDEGMAKLDVDGDNNKVTIYGRILMKY